ncbi:unnamed protein product [Clavelina lepadiformis]|uniref:Uncharacterized protein n=1 Tax=Clavelina lepadiformis TaxID=159417 RepID=A0ABP0G1W5_CLALP
MPGGGFEENRSYPQSRAETRTKGKIILEKKSISQTKGEWPFLLHEEHLLNHYNTLMEGEAIHSHELLDAITNRSSFSCNVAAKNSLAEFQRNAADQKLRKSLQRNLDTSTKQIFQRFMQVRKSTRITEVIDSGGVQHISSPSILKENPCFFRYRGPGHESATRNASNAFKFLEKEMLKTSGSGVLGTSDNVRTVSDGRNDGHQETSSVEADSQTPSIRRSTRERRPPQRYGEWTS